jgi:CDP-diacylglycerol--serine O-phosphatidyltransferase
MVSTIKFRSFKDLRFSWRPALLSMFAVTTGVVMAVKLHVAFAMCWLLTSYVLIGLFETLLGLARKLRRTVKS